MTASDPGLLTVQLRGLPVRLQHLAQQQHDGLVRELALIAERLRQQGDSGNLPVRLVAMVEQLGQQYGGMTEEQEQQLEDARDSGAETVDLTYVLPHAASGPLMRWDGSWKRRTSTAARASTCSPWLPRRTWSPTGAGS